MIGSNDDTLKGLLEAIRLNPADDGARLVLADWIDEHMPTEHALAELYRGGAKRWLQRLCERCRHAEGNDPDSEWFTYEFVVEAAADSIQRGRAGFSVGNVMAAQDILHENLEHFWVCIEVVLGVAVPDAFKESSGFSCAC